jgi:hypothetical protein
MQDNVSANDNPHFEITELCLGYKNLTFKDVSGEMCKFKWQKLYQELNGL